MPSFLENLSPSLIYQLFLRPFTPEGTLKGAEKMLPHLKRLGVDLIYLTPVCEADDDMNPRFWSRRMLECGFQNPRNPYRVKDYYKIDPEYGSAQDLKDFIHAAHALGMGVLLDVVYIHCGPGNALRMEHPDFLSPWSRAIGPFHTLIWKTPPCAIILQRTCAISSGNLRRMASGRIAAI